MYTQSVKKKELERKLQEFGWRLLRQGANHEIWTNGEINEPIPRHKEVHEYLAKKILKVTRENPSKE